MEKDLADVNCASNGVVVVLAAHMDANVLTPSLTTGRKHSQYPFETLHHNESVSFPFAVWSLWKMIRLADFIVESHWSMTWFVILMRK